MSYNAYIVVALATYAVAQVTKFAIAGMKGDVNFRYLYASGGMPSVHSALVSALTVTALLLDGMNSAIFGITAVFSGIVIYDSLNVRRSVGQQAASINKLLDGLEVAKVRFDYTGIRVKVVRGHSPLEVIAGVAMGVILGGLFNYDRISPLTSFLQTVPAHKELWLYAGIFAALVLIGAITNWILRSKYRKSRAIAELAKRILILSQTIGWLGLLSVVFMYEKASYLAWRFWPLTLIVIAIVWGVQIFVSARRTLPVSLRQEATEARKRKWFAFGRKKKR